MATKSGMNYTKIEALIKYLEYQKTSILDNLSELNETAPSRIAEHYSGQAADAYKESLDKVITKISLALEDMINSLKTNTDMMHEAYVNQDTKLQEATEESIQELTQQID